MSEKIKAYNDNCLKLLQANGYDAIIIDGREFILGIAEHKTQKDDYTESGIYAIEISDMSFFEDMNLVKKYPEERQTMYLALARTSKRPDIAEALAVEIISTNKK